MLLIQMVSRFFSPASWRAALCTIALLMAAGALRSQAGCQGQCRNPHEGEFKSWYGQTSGCQVQVWHQWPDGCLNYQWYNTCTGTWDNDSNGQPKVTWTCCVH